MVKQTIQIFARVRPPQPKQKLGVFEVSDEGGPNVAFFVPKGSAEGYINNKKDVYRFKFNRIFDVRATQDEVFQDVAQPVIDNVLSGYNGTIFAYGQTGSGKTFTISGGLDRYSDRGIVPRTLTYIFKHCAQETGSQYTVHISYLEIYNDDCFDLLHDLKNDAFKLEDLPKVVLLEDSEQNIHLKNLSAHQVANEEEALNLLFLGDTNRVIAETPMNQASTRSHCIFTVQVTSREEGSATIRRAKLHLVDLAGSERVAKTGVNGVILNEAKYINVSLHFLEQVIIALSEKNRQHVPYRNSMMTKVLRDSLGGNSLTTMIATVSIEKRNIDESISTCRFAQRVAMVKNDAVLNEELDPKLLIMKLKQRITELEEEIVLLKGGDNSGTGDLTDDEVEKCKDAVKYFLDDPDVDAALNVGVDLRKIRLCHKLLKKAVKEAELTSSKKPPDESLDTPSQDKIKTTPYDNSETGKLKGLLMQRDNEITILVNMLKKVKKELALSGKQGSVQPMATPTEQSMNSAYTRHDRESAESSRRYAKQPEEDRQSSMVSNDSAVSLQNDRSKQIVAHMSEGRQEAYDIFCRDCEQGKIVEEHKRHLKEKFVQAKRLGDLVKQGQGRIANLKSSLEKHRYSRVAQGLVDPNNPESDEMEDSIRQELESEKATFKKNLEDLRNLRTETEHHKYLLQAAKIKMTKDFELWWAEQCTNIQQSEAAPANLKSKEAWRTPQSTPGSSHSASRTPSFSSQGDNSGKSNGLDFFANRARHGVVPPVSMNGHADSRRGFLANMHNPNSGYLGNSSQYQRPSSKSSSRGGDHIQLTGDKDVDADILAFWEKKRRSSKR